MYPMKKYRNLNRIADKAVAVLHQRHESTDTKV